MNTYQRVVQQLNWDRASALSVSFCNSTLRKAALKEDKKNDGIIFAYHSNTKSIQNQIMVNLFRLLIAYVRKYMADLINNSMEYEAMFPLKYIPLTKNKLNK